MKKEIQIDAPKAHKDIKVIARCKRACGKTSKSVERVFSVSCRNHGIDLGIYLDKHGEYITYTDFILLPTVLESCQCIKYEIGKTDITADSPTAENGIIKLDPIEINEYIDIAAGVYCNVQKTFKEKLVFNILHCVETGIVKICGEQNEVPQTIKIYNGIVELEASRKADYICYSIDGGEFIRVDGTAASVAVEVGTHEVQAYAVYNEKQSKLNKQYIQYISISLLSAGGGYVLGAGNNEILGKIKGA